MQPQAEDTIKNEPLTSNPDKTIIVAGATGDLGNLIANCLINLGATVKALVRKGSKPGTVVELQKKGVLVAEVDFNNPEELIKACAGSTCVISALNGLEEVIVDGQMQLLKAAVEAGVPRFIPSDYCIDYTKLPIGSNRNLDLRRKFNNQLNKAPIAATSILSGMFTDLLTGAAPLVLFSLKRILYWGNSEQLLDFTTIANTANFTAHAALDPITPRYLRIAGDVIDIRGLREAASKATGKEFKLLRAGGLGVLQTMITITRALLPDKKEVFPPWQGMQYLHNMFTGVPKFEELDNDRYPGICWTSVEEVLSKQKL